MPPILRSILAIIAGFVTMSFIVIVFTLIAVSTLHLKSGHPTPAYLVFNVFSSFLAAAAGGLICGLTAPSRPVFHAGILAGIMIVMGAVSYLHYNGSQPRWYQVLLVLVPPVCALAGAAIAQQSARRRAL